MSTDEDSDLGILDLNPPMNCGCQELISSSIVTYHGWLRKRRNILQVKLLKWPQVYVVLADKNLYYFQSETSKKPAGAVNMYGFNRIIRVGERMQREAIWAFKLENIQTSVPSLYFAATSEADMVKWMKLIKKEMLIANGKQDKVTDDLQSGDSVSDQSYTSSVYESLESSVYEMPDGASAQRPKSVMVYSDDIIDDSDEHEEEDIPSSKPPSIPPRPLPSLPPEPVNRKGFGKNKSKKPEDYSLGQPVSPTSPGPMRSVEEEYWAGVHFEGNKFEASKAIDRIAESGVYLVRKSEDEQSHVLVVYTTAAKKYKIHVLENGWLTLSVLKGPSFESLEELLYHYYTNPLPGTEHKLVVPFKVHTK